MGRVFLFNICFHRDDKNMMRSPATNRFYFLASLPVSWIQIDARIPLPLFRSHKFTCHCALAIHLKPTRQLVKLSLTIK